MILIVKNNNLYIYIYMMNGPKYNQKRFQNITKKIKEKKNASEMLKNDVMDIDWISPMKKPLWWERHFAHEPFTFRCSTKIILIQF